MLPRSFLREGNRAMKDMLFVTPFFDGGADVIDIALPHFMRFITGQPDGGHDDITDFHERHRLGLYLWFDSFGRLELRR